MDSVSYNKVFFGTATRTVIGSALYKMQIEVAPFLQFQWRPRIEHMSLRKQSI